MSYINGAVLAVPTANKETYAEFAHRMSDVFKSHGATDVVDAWGVDVPPGETTSFEKAVLAKDDETIVFSWIVWPDKQTHDKGMEAVMQSDEMSAMKMPFDGKRMIFGSFEEI